MNTIEEPEQETSEAASECAHCGCEVDFDSTGSAIYDHNGNYEEVCDECFYEHALTCQVCGRDDVMPHEASSYILVKVELGCCTHPNAMPGIYKVRSRPFLSVPTIGSPSLHDGDLLFVDVLPKPDDHFEISGHICRKCAVPYSRIYGQTYGQLTRRKLRKNRGRRIWWNSQHDAAQRRRITDAFTTKPERLRDLECEPDDFKDEYGHYRLPNTVTYHEFVLMRRRGVTIYKPYAECDGGSWLLLKGEPRYRNMCTGGGYYHSHKLEPWVMFSGSGLPTWKQPKDWPYHSHYDKSQAALQAIRDAIDQGILRQDGVWVNGERQIIH